MVLYWYSLPKLFKITSLALKIAKIKHSRKLNKTVCIYIYIYIYIVYMWQMSVFSHESAQRNDAGHLIDKSVFKTTPSFCYQWFRVSTLQANATKHGKSTLNLWIVVNRIKCKRFLNSKPITRRRYIHTFINERSFLACQTFQISNFTSEYTPLSSQNAHTSSYKATYHDVSRVCVCACVCVCVRVWTVRDHWKLIR